MGYRNIVINSSVHLSVRNEQLDINGCKIPLEDINCLMIENSDITITTYLINKISQYGIASYICDEKHNPSTVLLPMVKHSRHFQMLEHQINMPKVLRKRLWKEIIKQKIRNQSLCLKEFKHEGYQQLSNMINEVQSGDKDHVESKAAAMYFNFLFGQDFHRREDSLINSSLNYCYAIVRGHIARSIVCHGFEPSIGLNHKSQLNSFNLADDFIEPYRAIVDYYVVNCLRRYNIEDVLDTELKHNLINIVQQDVLINEGKYTVSKSIDMMIGSFNSVICNKRENLLLPQLLPMSNHTYE